MEILRMDYRFTALLITMFIILTVFAKPAYPRNEYLNNGYNSCSTGSVDISVEQRDTDYINNGSSTHENENVRLTFRHFLGSACTNEFKKVQQENLELKQQLELMKMCGKVNKNPTLKYNPNFHLIVMKCSGIVIPENKAPEGSLWDELKDDYKKENPDVKLMGDKFLTPVNTLKIPPKDYILPLPKPTND